MSTPKPEIAPESEPVEDDDEPSLPQPDEFEAAASLLEDAAESLAAGRAAILRYGKLAPSRPGVYRMIDARGDVLYVGKAKSIKKRIAAYARPTGLDTRIERMIAATRTLEFIVTRTETEA
ncbi:MAG: GIY-YIG nuclease family protein, partial [Xanthobacteraceae bacterium]